MELFDETKIGSMIVKNHFIRSATFEGKATEDGRPTEKIKALYEDLAKAEVGTIITSYAYIADYEQPKRNQLGIYKDELIADYKKITDSVHQYNTRIIMQIVHGSSNEQGYSESAKILGPSPIEHPVSRITPMEMTKQDIQDVIRLFVDAGKRVKAAGFDGVQIHCAHGYLLAQFISPLFNHRNDEYGGSIKNRLRIVLEVYYALREALGDFPVWIKMNSSDEEENGLTTDDFIEMAKILSEAGIDAIEVSGNKWSSHKLNERAYYKDAAMKLANIIDTPVILTGGLREMNDLLPVYQNSRINFFGFARPFMIDVHFIQTLSKQ